MCVAVCVYMCVCVSVCLCMCVCEWGSKALFFYFFCCSNTITFGDRERWRREEGGSDSTLVIPCVYLGGVKKGENENQTVEV